MLRGGVRTSTNYPLFQMNGTPFSVTSQAAKLQSPVEFRDLAMSFECNLGEISFSRNAIIDDLLAPRSVAR